MFMCSFRPLFVFVRLPGRSTRGRMRSTRLIVLLAEGPWPGGAACFSAKGFLHPCIYIYTHTAICIYICIYLSVALSLSQKNRQRDMYMYIYIYVYIDMSIQAVEPNMHLMASAALSGGGWPEEGPPRRWLHGQGQKRLSRPPLLSGKTPMVGAYPPLSIIRVYIHVYTYVYICVCIYICICVYTCVYVYIYTHIYIYMYVSIYLSIYLSI